MSDPSRTITITTDNNREDIKHGIEISANTDPPGQWRKPFSVLLVISGLAGIFAVLSNISPIPELWDALLIICVTCSGFALLNWLLNTVGRRLIRKHQMKELEAEDDPFFVGTYNFEENRVLISADIASITIEYSNLTRCLEYTDGLYFEHKGHGYFYIPARYISAIDHAEISRRLSEKCKAYRVMSPIHAPIEATEVTRKLPDDIDSSDGEPRLLLDLRWTPTDEEIDEAALLIPQNNKTKRIALIVYRVSMLLLVVIMGLILAVVRPLPWLLFLLIAAALVFTVIGPRLIAGSARKEQRKIMKAEQESGARVAFFDTLLLVRLLGDDILIPYSIVDTVLETDRFISFSLDSCQWRITIPLRVIENKEQFLAMLSPNAVNGEENAEQAGLVRSEHPDSSPLRDADMSHGRTLLSARFDGMNISARRLTGVTELIIDGKVYAEQKGMLEFRYVIHAWMKGIMYSFSFSNNDYKMRLMADSRRIAEKLRYI